MRRWLAAMLVLLPVACGGGTGSRAEPETVVRMAPDRTLAEHTARVEAAAPDAASAGRLRLSDPASVLPLTGSGAARGYPELSRPLALLDAVRGAVEVVSYGGTAVRGASTFRYETVLDLEQAVKSTPEPRRTALREMADRLGSSAFYADVWVDDQGRIRRIQVPLRKTAERPGSRERRTPELITVDFFDFGP